MFCFGLCCLFIILNTIDGLPTDISPGRNLVLGLQELLDIKSVVKLYSNSTHTKACPDHSKLINGDCLNISIKRITLHKAILACESQNGYLAEPTPTKENIIAMNMELRKYFPIEFWIIDQQKMKEDFNQFPWIGLLENGSDADFVFMKSKLIIKNGDPIMSNVNKRKEYISQEGATLAASTFDTPNKLNENLRFYLCQFDKV